MLFKSKKEIQSLINSRTKALKKAESQIDNRNRFIYKQQEEMDKLKQENKDLRFELEEYDEFVERLERFLNSNKYNNEKSTLNKIKELVNDYQSRN